MNAKTTATLNPVFQMLTPIGYVGTQGTNRGVRYYLNGKRTSRATIQRKINKHYSKGGE